MSAIRSPLVFEATTQSGETVRSRRSKRERLGWILLDDCFDDEVSVAQLLEVVLDVSDLDQARSVLREEGSRPRRNGPLQPRDGEAVSRGGGRSLGVAEVGGHDVHEEDFDAGVGEVRGDAAAHDARADDGGAADWMLIELAPCR